MKKNRCTEKSRRSTARCGAERPTVEYDRRRKVFVVRLSEPGRPVLIAKNLFLLEQFLDALENR